MESCWSLTFPVQRKDWVKIKGDNREIKWKPACWLVDPLPCSLNATASFLWPTYHPPRAGSWRVPLRINQRALNKSTDIWEFPEERRAYYMNILQWGIPVASYIELAIWFFSPSLLKHDLAKDHQKLGGKLRTWRPDQNKKKKRNLEENWGIT